MSHSFLALQIWSLTKMVGVRFLVSCHALKWLSSQAKSSQAWRKKLFCNPKFNPLYQPKSSTNQKLVF